MEGDLRVVLAVLGIFVVAFVYWHTRRQQKKPDTDQVSHRVEPVFDSETGDELGIADDDGALPEPHSTAQTVRPTLAPDQEPDAPPQAEKIVAIRVLAKGANSFEGEQLILALRGLGLRHGKFGIFHRHDDDTDKEIFSVANLVEPGTFDLANIRDQSLPGVSLFMVLPGAQSGTASFDNMVETARTLAKTLEGEVVDAAGSSLSIQRERFIREEIIQYELALAS